MYYTVTQHCAVGLPQWPHEWGTTTAHNNNTALRIVVGPSQRRRERERERDWSNSDDVSFSNFRRKLEKNLSVDQHWGKVCRSCITLQDQTLKLSVMSQLYFIKPTVEQSWSHKVVYNDGQMEAVMTSPPPSVWSKEQFHIWEICLFAFLKRFRWEDRYHAYVRHEVVKGANSSAHKPSLKLQHVFFYTLFLCCINKRDVMC